MQLTASPRINPRYWSAILVASICGTNIGDVLHEVIKAGAVVELALLAVLFAVNAVVATIVRRSDEVFYWIAILMVRAAATSVADFSTRGHQGYVGSAVAFAGLLVALFAITRSIGTRLPVDVSLRPTGLYWLTMLVAGVVGTVVGDGLMHSFGPVQVGIFISAGISSAIIAIILMIRAKLRAPPPATYWLAVVAVRWWGSNLGDILAFLMTLTGSMAITIATLVLMLYILREQQPTTQI